jgi:hypothetical protein
VIFKPYYLYETGCAASLFGCGGLGKCAVVDAHEREIDGYAECAATLSDVPRKPVELELILRANPGLPEPHA